MGKLFSSTWIPKERRKIRLRTVCAANSSQLASLFREVIRHLNYESKLRGVKAQQYIQLAATNAIPPPSSSIQIDCSHDFTSNSSPPSSLPPHTPDSKLIEKSRLMFCAIACLYKLSLALERSTAYMLLVNNFTPQFVPISVICYFQLEIRK